MKEISVKEYSDEQPYRQLLLYGGIALMLGGIVGLIITQVGNPLYIVVGLAGLVAFIASVVSVEFGLLFLIFISYTRFSDIAVHYYNAPSVAKSFVVLLLVSILIRWAVFNEQPKGWLRPLLLIGVYGLVGFASFAYAQDTQPVALALTEFVKDAIIAIVVVMLLQNGTTLRRVIWTLLVVGIFLGTLSVFQYLTNSFTNEYGGFAQANVMQIVLGEADSYRIAGPIGDPNFYAQVMVVLVPLALERLMHEKRIILRILAGWAFIVSALTVVLTFSRGGFLAMAVSVLVFLILYPPKPNYVPLLMVAAVVILLAIPPSYYERIVSLKEIFQAGSVNYRFQDLAIRGRASETLTGLEMFRQHPFLGVGVGNYSYLYQDYAKSIGLAPTASSARSAHNLYLEVLAERGAVGFTVFMFLIGISVTTVVNARRKFIEAKMNTYAGLATGFLVGIIGYLVAAVFVHNAYPRYFYLLIGIALSFKLVAENTIPYTSSSIGHKKVRS
jgi:putative inorganic carbon (HCO3(-)) transporter